MASEISRDPERNDGVITTGAILRGGNFDGNPPLGNSPPHNTTTPDVNSQSHPIIITDDENDICADDKILLYPKPRKEQLSRRDQRAKRQANRLKGPTWQPGNIIRLLPETVHIKTNPRRGLNIDPDLPAPPPVPKRLKLPSESQMMLVGRTNRGTDDEFFYESIADRGWKDGSPVFLRIILPGPERFQVIDASGQEVDYEIVQWAPGVGTIDQQLEGCAEKLHAKVREEMVAIDGLFRREAKRYRTQRRLWEIRVVRHEFMERGNLGIFRPGTTRAAVWRTIRMGAADMERDR